MDLGVISVRYARALLKSAVEEAQEDKVYEDMKCLYDNFIALEGLRNTIDNPMLAKDKKLTLSLAACSEKPAALTKRFLKLVFKEERECALQFMAASYITHFRRRKNLITGKLITATKVSSEVETKMRKLVESKSQGKVEFLSEVDPDIIGGFILEYDTYRMDASVRQKLQSILVELKK